MFNKCLYQGFISMFGPDSGNPETFVNLVFFPNVLHIFVLCSTAHVDSEDNVQDSILSSHIRMRPRSEFRSSHLVASTLLLRPLNSQLIWGVHSPHHVLWILASWWFCIPKGNIVLLGMLSGTGFPHRQLWKDLFSLTSCAWRIDAQPFSLGAHHERWVLLNRCQPSPSLAWPDCCLQSLYPYLIAVPSFAVPLGPIFMEKEAVGRGC